MVDRGPNQPFCRRRNKHAAAAGEWMDDRHACIAKHRPSGELGSFGGRNAGEGETLESAVIYAKLVAHERTATEDEWNTTRAIIHMGV